MSHASSPNPSSPIDPELDPTATWPEYCETTAVGQWLPDILGTGFSYTSLPLGSDEEGELTATLIRYRESGTSNVPVSTNALSAWPRWIGQLAQKNKLLGRMLGVSAHDAPATRSHPQGFVLAIHGWSDYFYNAELATYWTSRGYAFYALDLRRYGRSLRAHHQDPGFTTDLNEYDEDISAALERIRELEGNDLPGVCVAHSTGGLIASLWVNRNPKAFSALILNSPWLEMQGSYLVRYATQGLLEPIAKRRPRASLHLPEFDNYWRSLSRLGRGSWDLHPRWRPPVSFPPTAGWMTAILAGHRLVAKGLDIKIPILVLTSRTTHLGTSFDESMLHNDTVIEVQVVRERSLGLGREVTNVIIEGSMHDVFTSLPKPRSIAYAGLDHWAAGYLPSE
ncbi:lysophospholipase [Arthrobacter sp. MYb227]|uniref:alpha/beta hydrolase n=1 Tax=Arthrobacter sp. MYb227 TaxID=1848601 RepID=UPI000CFB9EBF|nr:alpha/beta hydrolase [Arthrobacter sp. MYb227]PQZ93856.1 lysophospholipase [Arthrobacter sp. MYb227]